MSATTNTQESLRENLPERTYLMVKPDGVQRGLIGEIITRFEKKGFKLVGLKMLQMTRAMAEDHYAEHQGKPFFEKLVAFITSGPVVAMAWEGRDVVRVSREMIGATNPSQAAPGSIRGSLAVESGRNVIHGSDSPLSAKRELAIFFQEGELLSYERTLDRWLLE